MELKQLCEKVIELFEINQNLTELREAMLPDLMSGKLQLGSEQTEC